jgi:subtilisin
MKWKSLFALLAVAFVTSAWADDPIHRIPEGELKPLKVLDRNTILSELPTNAVFQHGFDKLQERGITGAKVRIAVLDTGVDSKHIDLAGAVVAEKDFTGSRNGAMDVQGHGTHVAGTIAARKNTRGVYGNLPDAEIINGKVLDDDGSGKGSWIAAGIDWAVENQADVISMSLGSSGKDPQIINAIDRAYKSNPSIMIAVAAGNDGPAGNTVNWPGKHLPVFTCAAVESTNTKADYSSWGKEVDGAAVGTLVLSTWPGNRLSKISGSSMTTPTIASGMAAYKQRCFELKRVPTQAEFEKLFIASALRAGSNRSDELGWGVLRVNLLIEELDKLAIPPAPTPKPGLVTISFTDLSAAKQIELRAVGVDVFSLTVGHSVKPSVVATNTTLTPAPLKPACVMPEWAEQTRPRTGTYEWRDLPGVGPGWVQVGTDPVSLTAPVPRQMPAAAQPSTCPPSGCPGGVCPAPVPSQSTRSIPLFPRLWK